jgi:hypothetical protein
MGEAWCCGMELQGYGAVSDFFNLEKKEILIYFDWQILS